MVKDNVNLYFTNLLKDLQKQYSSLKGGQVYKATPPSFPYMYFKQIGGDGALSTLSNTETVSILDWKSNSIQQIRLRSAEVSKFRKGIYGRDWISLRLLLPCGECKRYFHFTIPYQILKTGNMINSIG